MNSNVRNQLVYCLTAALVSLLTSCAPRQTLPPTSTPLQPIASQTEPSAMKENASLFKAGVRYSDRSDDMAVPFLDVVAFQASIDEASETLEANLYLRDIPENAPLGQVRNLPEYSWMIFVYLDPTTASPENTPGDYYFGLNTEADEPFASEALTPIPGTPMEVPFYQLFEIRFLYNSLGYSVSTPEVNVNPDLNKLTMTARVPGIKSNAVFSFGTYFYDGTTDRPDNHVHPASASLSTPLPEATISANDGTTQLTPAGRVHAYPGPDHYAGDILTFEIFSTGNFDDTFTVSLTLDTMPPRDVQATLSIFQQAVIPYALDTTDLLGHHMVKFTTADGQLNETYSFNVLPAEQRPANETNAVWGVQETACCIFHFLSGTAAARDIDFIAENFQQGARDLEALIGREVGTKMDVYLLDRMLYNGGFGGGGRLFISYTDRYYGPTVGSAGLQTVARHEFSHAADIGPENQGDGIEYNYEGLAVYLAGGHYKPEPLAQRGAALYDLEQYAPVTDFIPQHELSYLHAALIPTYIVDTYGEEKLWEFLSADADIPDEQPLPMGEAVQAAFGIPLAEFDEGFRAWLEKNESGDQFEDLRLTVELQDARREYQNEYSPGPIFIVFDVTETFINKITQPENRSLVMREARTPANIAIELMIANAQRDIVASTYTEAEQLIQAIKAVLATGNFESPPAKDYLDIVLAAGEAGYEVLSLNIQNGYATAQVTQEPPMTTILVLRNVNGTWQIEL